MAEVVCGVDVSSLQSVRKTVVVKSYGIRRVGGVPLRCLCLHPCNLAPVWSGLSELPHHAGSKR